MLRISLTFTAGQWVAPLSFILTLEHWLPQQVEAGVAGKLDLGPRAHLHIGGMQVGHCILQFGAIWQERDKSPWWCGLKSQTVG